jgi:hypothetical protein
VCGFTPHIVIMPIGSRQQVRNLTGIFDINDLPDADIDAAILKGKGELYAVTLKTDWDTSQSHPLYTKAETLVEYFASFTLLDRYAGNQVKANQHREREQQLAIELKTQYDQYLLAASAGDPSLARHNVVVSKYKSWPLNEDASIPKSKIIIPGD